jgi:hypothetical protein
MLILKNIEQNWKAFSILMYYDMFDRALMYYDMFDRANLIFFRKEKAVVQCK